MKRCILRVIKYKKFQRGRGFDLNIDIKNIKNEMEAEINIDDEK
jgi:hypothetical protein